MVAIMLRLGIACAIATGPSWTGADCPPAKIINCCGGVTGNKARPAHAMVCDCDSNRSARPGVTAPSLACPQTSDLCRCGQRECPVNDCREAADPAPCRKGPPNSASVALPHPEQAPTGEIDPCGVAIGGARPCAAPVTEPTQLTSARHPATEEKARADGNDASIIVRETAFARGKRTFTTAHRTGTGAMRACADCHDEDGSGYLGPDIRMHTAEELMAHAQGNGTHLDGVKFIRLTADDFRHIEQYLASMCRADAHCTSPGHGGQSEGMERKIGP